MDVEINVRRRENVFRLRWAFKVEEGEDEEEEQEEEEEVRGG